MNAQIALSETGNAEQFLRAVASADHGDQCVPWPYQRRHYGRGAFKLRLEDGRYVNRYAHRFVCELVNGPPLSPDHQAAHSCGKGHEGCINPKHLSWKTRAENEADKILHGTSNRGERQGRSKLSREIVRRIRTEVGTKPQKQIAREFGITQQSVSDIVTGRTWGWL